MRKKNRRWPGKIKQMLICTGLVLCLIVGAIPSTPCHAQGRVKPEMVLPKGYPDGFDVYGRIDTIEQGQVVIDDDPFRLAPEVTYNIPTRMNASKAYFRPGALVGVLINSKGHAISLWLLE